MSAGDLNAPSRWLSWLRACETDAGSPIRLPGPLGMLTGQDTRALGAIAACWALYASSDENGERAALEAIRALLPALQQQCRPFARELIAQSLDWGDRERLWSLVQGTALPVVDQAVLDDAVALIVGQDILTPNRVPFSGNALHGIRSRIRLHTGSRCSYADVRASLNRLLHAGRVKQEQLLLSDGTVLFAWKRGEL